MNGVCEGNISLDESDHFYLPCDGWLIMTIRYYIFGLLQPKYLFIRIINKAGGYRYLSTQHTTLSGWDTDSGTNSRLWFFSCPLVVLGVFILFLNQGVISHISKQYILPPLPSPWCVRTEEFMTMDRYGTVTKV